MIRKSSIFHVVEVAYKDANESAFKTQIWDILKAQTKGFWFEYQHDEPLSRVVKGFPDGDRYWYQSGNLFDSSIAYYCFRENEDAQLLLTYLRVMEEKE